MNCRLVDKWIDAALDEGLTGERKAHFEAHLEACPRCRAQWQVLRAADAALRAPRPVPAPEGMLTEFRQRLAQEEAARELRSPRRLWRWLWPAASFAAAGAAAAVVIGLNLAPAGGPLSRSQAPSSPPPMAGRTAPERPPRMHTDLSDVPAPSGPEAPSTPRVEAVPPDTKGLYSSRPAPAAPPEARPHRPVEMADARLPRPSGSDRPRELDPMSNVGPRVDRPERTKAGVSVERSPARDADHLLPSAPVAGLAGGFGGGSEPATRANFRAANAPALGVPLALEANTQLVQSELLPPEFNVSPAVLTALRRDVEVEVEKAPVREAVARLTESADVVVRVDPSIQPLRVSVQQEGAPLWVALQSVAQQGKLQIVPEDNHLLLLPQVPPPPAGAAPAPTARLKDDQAQRLQPFGKTPQGERRGGSVLREELRANARFAQKARSLPAPDPSVWSRAWGQLPRNGFEPPRPEELPPSIAELPQAMDEARQADKSSSYFYQRLRQEPPAAKPAPAPAKKAPGSK